MKAKDVPVGKVFKYVESADDGLLQQTQFIKLYGRTNVVNVATWTAAVVDDDDDVVVLGDAGLIREDSPRKTLADHLVSDHLVSELHVQSLKQVQDADPITQAEAFLALRQRDLSCAEVGQIAKQAGLCSGEPPQPFRYVRERLLLLKLSPEEQEKVRTGKINVTKALRLVAKKHS